jgi:TolB-like protein
MAFPLPDKPSIAVLPFTNMSDDREQEHFADGMTDDLITDLSKISDLFVIARNSTFVYKGKAVEVRQVAEDLGVRYVLEGSVRRAGTTMRVNAQLLDASTGGHVWADRFDGGIDDIFAIQDEFVRKIVKALALNLSVEEENEIARGQTANLEAWEEFQRGWDAYHGFTFEGNIKAIEHLQKAIELDPEYGRAYAALALAHFRDNEWAWMRGPASVDVQRSGAASQAYLEEAKKYPTALSHVFLSLDHLWYGRQQEGVDEAVLAIAADPNEPEAYIAMAWAKIGDGQPESSLTFIDTALRLNPNHASHYELPRGLAFLAIGDLETAREVFEEALERNPDALVFAPPLAAIYAYADRRVEAREMLMRWRPGANQQELEYISYRLFVYNEELRERLSDGLDLAALPLDVTIPDLITALQEGGLLQRKDAARKLSWFGPSARVAIPALIEALSDEDMVQHASTALGRMGPVAADAIPVLEAVPEEYLHKYYAEQALKKITAQ